MWRRPWGVFDLPVKEQRIAALEREASDPSFWTDSRKAQKTMREMAGLRDEVAEWHGLEERASNVADLLELAIDEDDESIQADARSEIRQIERRLNQLEFDLQLSGEYDERSAIVAVKAGAGGTEAQDWAAMLFRMYIRWGERRGFKVNVLDSMPGDEAGIKSATVEIQGRHAYGYLKADRGVHRLVRLSPFDSDHARHTSFALVEVLPEADPEEDITINPDDLRIDTFRAGGHGGQNVQKNSSAIRITHNPSGLVVSVQNERSLQQNRDVAMGILYSRLMDLEIQRRTDERRKLRGEHVSAEWGRQVRSYVLHPYRMVKDHRTGHESSDPDGVLDGDLDELFEAYLRANMESGVQV